MNGTNTLDNVVVYYRKLANTISDNPDITKELSSYQSKYLIRGVELVTEIARQLDLIENSLKELPVPVQSYLAMLEQAQRTYQRIAGKLLWLASLNPKLMRIAPPIVDAVSEGSSLQTALSLYTTLLNCKSSYTEMLDAVAISDDELREALAELGNVAAAKIELYSNSASGITYNSQKGELVEEQLAYFKDLLAIARITLRNKPLLFDKLAIE